MEEIITIEGFEGDTPDVRFTKRKLELFKKRISVLEADKEELKNS